MSIIGVDVGTSSIKASAYSDAGALLAGARRAVPSTRTRSGVWEIDVGRSRIAFLAALRTVARHPTVRADPVRALAISASGREVFPVASDGRPLGPCLTTADSRGDEEANEVSALLPRAEWLRLVGHVPERMDPACRVRWWMRADPAVVARTRWFLNWHDYYTLLLAGEPVADTCNAGAWAVFDAKSGRWSRERLAATGLREAWLPEIAAPGTLIGRIRGSVAADVGLSPTTIVATGAWDAFAGAVGSAATRPGEVALACGTWNTFVLSIPGPVARAAAEISDGVYPHPGPSGRGLLSADPNGMSVVDWACRLLRLRPADLDAALDAPSDRGPGPLDADPCLVAGRGQREPTAAGRLSGLTLSTEGWDVVRAIVEGITCRLANRIEMIRTCGVRVSRIRATGGGARLAWMMQLTADVTGLPVEVMAADEPGTLGAAILAARSTGRVVSSSAGDDLVRLGRRYEPDKERGSLFAGVLARLAPEAGTR